MKVVKNISEAMKKVNAVYQPSIFGHQHYAVIMKNGDVYDMDYKNTYYVYAGTLYNLPHARDGRRINKSYINDELKRAIADIL